jgi:hypothetical protein
MGLALCTKVTFPLPFDVIPESSLFAVNCSRSQGAIDISAPGSRPGCTSGPGATRAVSLVQNRKTIPAEGSQVCVVAPFSGDASGR